MERKEIVKYFYEVVVTNHLLEEVDQYVSEDCVLKRGEELIPIGIEGMRDHLIAVKNTYPDYSMKIIRQYCDGDYVISEFIMEGTHKGEWLGMKPTNKKLVFNGVDVDKVTDGKIVEHGGAVNTFETLFQEGLIMPEDCTDKSGENKAMSESDVELKLADCPEQVAAIVRETIQKIYPHYYPVGAVQFFLDLHSAVRIEKAMSSEEIYLVMVQGNIIGTGSIRKNEICRLFILPEYQGKGYGSRLMDLLEARIFEKYPKVHVDASFPAESMYLKRGYQMVSYEKIETENGDFLCYHTMEKERDGNLSV